MTCVEEGAKRRVREREREREVDILHLVNYLEIVQLTGHQVLLHVWVEEQLLSQHELDQHYQHDHHLTINKQ